MLVATVQGTSTLQALSYARGEVMGMGGGMGNDPQSRHNVELTTLATLQVTGDEATPLPPVTARAHQLDLRGGPLSARRRLILAMGMGMGGGGMSFTIDGKQFAPDRIDQTVQSGTIEEWTITNTSPMDHPIHQNKVAVSKEPQHVDWSGRDEGIVQ